MQFLFPKHIFDAIYYILFFQGFLFLVKILKTTLSMSKISYSWLGLDFFF